MITYIKLLLMTVFWGGTFIAGRVITRDVQPFSATFTRFVIASVLLTPPVTWQIDGNLPTIKHGRVLHKRRDHSARLGPRSVG